MVKLAVVVGLCAAALAVAWTIGTSRNSASVFDGVSDADLAESGILVTDKRPASQAQIPEVDIRRIVLSEPGIVVEDSQLVTMKLTSRSAPSSPEHLAWALRLDTSNVPLGQPSGPGFWINAGPDLAIVFFDANNGEDLATYVRPTTGAAQATGSRAPPTP